MMEGQAVELAPNSRGTELGYYGLPMLKRPLWGWQIALYFFSEGISSGCYVLGTAAEFFGGRSHRRLVRTARYISFLALLPCPPLLISDLGDPARFHHMLRIFKPLSPMNLGAWALFGFSQPVTYLALREAAEALPVVRKMPRRIVAAMGLPFAITMLAYPGVLLSMTSTPIWTRTRLLGALLGASSMSMAATSLALACALDPEINPRSRAAVHRIQSTAHLCEAGLLAAYVVQSGRAADPLTRGKQAKLFWLGAIGCGLIAPAILVGMRATARKKRPNLWSSVLSLAGGLALKWALVHAGHESALDPAASRHATRPTAENPGWR
jgi:formate-dependent nitrite reductase membrane component NrfD